MPFVVGVDLVGVRVRFRARAQFGARGGVWGRVRSQVRLGLGFEALGADRSAVERMHRYAAEGDGDSEGEPGEGEGER